jgi:kelch-like protein 2/3
MALRQSHSTAVGPDGIHYQFLKHLPLNVQIIVLDLLNQIWKK